MKSFTTVLILCLVSTVLFYSCQSSDTTGSTEAPTPSQPSLAGMEGAPKTIKIFTDLDAVGFQNKMNDPNIVVLDVRRPGEIANGKIEGAREIDFLASDFKEKIQKLDRDKTYLVYCASGKRSVGACRKMAESGFKHLYNLDGGYQAWQRSQQAQH